MKGFPWIFSSLFCRETGFRNKYPDFCHFVNFSAYYVLKIIKKLNVLTWPAYDIFQGGGIIEILRGKRVEIFLFPPGQKFILSFLCLNHEQLGGGSWKTCWQNLYLKKIFNLIEKESILKNQN